MLDFRAVSEEVLYTRRPITALCAADVSWLVEKAKLTPRKRIRICAHPEGSASVHEMVIVHARDAYVRPHKHLQKPESFHLIQGELTVLVFDDAQTLLERIPMGPPASGRVFYYRLEQPLFHTVVIESDFAVFHETTAGPFDRSQTIFPPWAPEERDPEAARYHAHLRTLTKPGT